ncbi:MAG: hypothetical protein O3A95_03630 [Planctomycetota bacterium]|nr:hypothetical protein [Planctomycetota bacterium]MDA1113372.1 hypothetical protein [Planctomycetota bacterium]
MKHLLTCLLLLGACTAPQTNSPNAETGLSGGSVKAPATPTNYEQWLESLPSHTQEASKPFQVGFTGKILVNVPTEKVSVEVQISGSMEYADVRHFRQIIDLHLDLGDLPGNMAMGPIKLSLNMNADGESLHAAPGFHDDWLLAMVEQANMGFEKMVFTLDLDVLEQMLEVYWKYFDSEDIDLSNLLPESMDAEEFFQQGINPAAWAQMYMLTANIDDFRVDSGEVHVTASIKDEWIQRIHDQETRTLMESATYEMSFDRYSGIPTNMGMTMSAEGKMGMEFSVEFLDFKIGDGLFSSDHFKHQSMEGRAPFPVDTFMQMALGSMQGQMEEVDDDIPF